MPDTIETVRVEGEGLTVSLLVWRRFQQSMPGAVEAILDLNPGLADFGPFLPVGTIVQIPVPSPRVNADVTPVRLWR